MLELQFLQPSNDHWLSKIIVEVAGIVRRDFHLLSNLVWLHTIFASFYMIVFSPCAHDRIIFPLQRYCPNRMVYNYLKSFDFLLMLLCYTSVQADSHPIHLVGIPHLSHIFSSFQFISRSLHLCIHFFSISWQS